MLGASGAVGFGPNPAGRGGPAAAAAAAAVVPLVPLLSSDQGLSNSIRNNVQGLHHAIITQPIR